MVNPVLHLNVCTAAVIGFRRESVAENLNFLTQWCSQRLSFILYVIMAYFPFGFPCRSYKVQHTQQLMQIKHLQGCWHAKNTFFSVVFLSWWSCPQVKLSLIDF